MDMKRFLKWIVVCIMNYLPPPCLPLLSFPTSLTWVGGGRTRKGGAAAATYVASTGETAAGAVEVGVGVMKRLPYTELHADPYVAIPKDTKLPSGAVIAVTRSESCKTMKKKDGNKKEETWRRPISRWCLPADIHLSRYWLVSHWSFVTCLVTHLPVSIHAY